MDFVRPMNSVMPANACTFKYIGRSYAFCSYFKNIFSTKQKAETKNLDNRGIKSFV